MSKSLTVFYLFKRTRKLCCAAGVFAGSFMGAAAISDAEEQQKSVTQLPDFKTVASTLSETQNRTMGRPATESFKQNPRLQLRSQGSSMAQNDLQIMGSSFSGAGLAINGLALQHPQTAHFLTELPLQAAFFTKPTVYTGSPKNLNTTGHLVGTVDLSLAPVSTGGLAELGISENGGDRQSVFGHQAFNIPSGQLALGAFGNRRSGMLRHLGCQAVTATGNHI